MNHQQKCAIHRIDMSTVGRRELNTFRRGDVVLNSNRSDDVYLYDGTNCIRYDPCKGLPGLDMMVVHEFPVMYWSNVKILLGGDSRICCDLSAFSDTIRDNLEYIEEGGGTSHMVSKFTTHDVTYAVLYTCRGALHRHPEAMHDVLIGHMRESKTYTYVHDANFTSGVKEYLDEEGIKLENVLIIRWR